MTLQEWQQSRCASLHYRRGQRLINRYVFEVQLLIGGIILGDGFVMSFHGQHDVRIEALACIGSGGGAAFRHLMRRSQNAHMSLPRDPPAHGGGSRRARLEAPETVGSPADYVVITGKRTRRMPANDPTLQQMLSKYRDADTEEIDSSDRIWGAVQPALYLSGVSKEEHAQGFRAARRGS
jgi:hypothetical protein